MDAILINYLTIFKTRWGFFGVLADEKGLLKTCLPMKTRQAVKKHLLTGISKKANEVEILSHSLQKAIINYYNGVYVDFQSLKIIFNFDKLTDFQKRVLKACRKIKIGETATYGQLAIMAGCPGAARAVGSVMAKNQWPLLIGCHRIVKSDGSIGNFSFGGSKTKKKMLEHEQKIKN
jgi:methylated-DNA-[protein]-cysteine S-methyltransferase